MTATDETEEQWLPLGVGGDEAFKFTAPWIEIPVYFQQSLWEWIEGNLIERAYNGDLSIRVGLIRQAGRKLHVKLPHFEHYNVSSGKSLLRNRYNELGAKPVRERTDGLPLRRSRPGGHRIQVLPPDGFRSPENQRQGGRR
jgi:hypothetical protein